MADLTPGETPKAQDQVPAGETPKDAEEEPFDKARAMETIRKQREEMKDLKGKAKRLTELEAAEAERKQAEMTEAQKLQAKLEKLEADNARAQATANDRLLRAEVLAKAAALNFNDPADAVALIDRSKLSINDSGDVEGADALLADLAKAKPYMLKKQGQAPLNSGNPGQAQTGETPAQARARLYGAGQSIFDRGASDQMGGGVFMSADNPKQQP